MRVRMGLRVIRSRSLCRHSTLAGQQSRANDGGGGILGGEEKGVELGGGDVLGEYEERGIRDSWRGFFIVESR